MASDELPPAVSDPAAEAAVDPTTAAAEEPQSSMPNPNPSPCAHSIPPALAPRLPDSAVCPSCTVTRHISQIRDVQNVLRTRGGVFFSRGRPKSDNHRALMDRWRQSKVQLLNLVSILEASISEHPGEDWKDVNEALSAWEREKEGLAKVPGYVYEGEAVKLSDEVASLVDEMLEGLKNSILGLMLDDGPEVVVAKPDTAGQAPTPASTTPSSATAPTAISVSMSDQESTSDPMAHPAPLTLQTRSCLKRKLAGHETPSAWKRVRTADFATVSSEQLTISNPSPFLKLSTDEPLRPHSPSTSAELKRRKSHFSRSSDSYVPGAWASPAFCTKPNTSCFKLEWDEVEELWKEEEEEVAEEKRVHERLRVIAEVHLMCWWVRNIATHIGIEKVLKIGQAAAESREAPPEGSDGVA